MNKVEVKYGLPAEVKFCKKCVISNQRPNSVIEHLHTKDAKKPTMHFNEEGVCEACHINEMTAVMTAFCPVRAGKTAFMPRTC